MRVLVLNAGSSSLKASVLEDAGKRTLARGEVSLGPDAVAGAARRDAVRRIVTELERQARPETIEAIGHRVVHGGSVFTGPALIDDGVLDQIERLGEFAPLHNPVAVETIRAAQEVLPERPQVAAFDTAFHASMPEASFVYPLPYSWYEDWGVRRFGFHGLSAQWSMHRAGELLERPASDVSLVVAHLGSGCSVTAIFEGRSVFNSMGLTPLEGLMMGTRAGSIDPGILFYLLRSGKLHDWRAAEEALDHESGFVGVSGRKAGMHELEQAAGAGDRRARLAIDMFIQRAASGIAGAATYLPRLDALVFTGGIGENSVAIRSKVCKQLSLLGIPSISRDPVEEDRILTLPKAGPAVLRVEAREDSLIAKKVESLLVHP